MITGSGNGMQKSVTAYREVRNIAGTGKGIFRCRLEVPDYGE